ncbi:MAG TPA: RcnB family protein [Steroidobacteraceae bacterium]|nr:RcnB family protein [Steroidobacteraceae bacterium]
MRKAKLLGTSLLCVLLSGGAALAAEQGHAHDPPERGAPRGEPHRGPTGYHRVAPPKGWNTRPATVDHGAYQHNFRAARSYHIGPYHRPVGWVPHTWVYGEILPRAYWTAEYLIADYWLFALEVPPAGYEWVRDGADALLVNIDTGEILQVEYGVFG